MHLAAGFPADYCGRRLFISDSIRDADSGVANRKISEVASDQEAVSKPCCGPNNGVRKPDSMLLSQRNRFAGDRFIKLDHFEIAQQILHSLLIFAIASAGEHLDPTDPRYRRPGVAPNLAVSLFTTVEQV